MSMRAWLVVASLFAVGVAVAATGDISGAGKYKLSTGREVQAAVLVDSAGVILDDPLETTAGIPSGQGFAHCLYSNGSVDGTGIATAPADQVTSDLMEVSTYSTAGVFREADPGLLWHTNTASQARRIDRIVVVYVASSALSATGIGNSATPLTTGFKFQRASGATLGAGGTAVLALVGNQYNNVTAITTGGFFSTMSFRTFPGVLIDVQSTSWWQINMPVAIYYGPSQTFRFTAEETLAATGLSYLAVCISGVEWAL